MRFARRAWVMRCPWLDQLEDEVEEQEEVGPGGTGLEVHNVSWRDQACPSSRRTGGSSRRLEGPGTALAGVQANVIERLGLQNDALHLDRRDLRQLLPKLPCLVIRGLVDAICEALRRQRSEAYGCGSLGTLWPGSRTSMRFVRRAWVRRCPFLDQPPQQSRPVCDPCREG